MDNDSDDGGGGAHLEDKGSCKSLAAIAGGDLKGLANGLIPILMGVRQAVRSFVNHCQPLPA